MGLWWDLTYHVQMPHGGAVSLVKSPIMKITFPTIAIGDLLMQYYIVKINVPGWGKIFFQIPYYSPVYVRVGEYIDKCMTVTRL